MSTKWIHTNKRGDTLKILFIRPIITNRSDFLEEDIIKQFSHSGIEIVARHLEYGPESIENEFDLVYSSPYVVEESIKGEQDGFDGIVSYCFGNPGVDACREAVTVPVIGSGEASMTLASAIGRRISIVTILPNIVPMIMKQNQEYLFNGKLVSVRNANIPVTSIGDGSETIFDKIFCEAEKSVTEDKADVIVLGCTGFAGFAERITDRLQERNINVPVIDPAAASLKMIEALVTCGVFNSSMTYMKPIDKIIKLPKGY